MKTVLLFVFNSALLGVGLAMDAFSVSLANGLAEPGMSRKRMAAMAGVYAGFQFAMPLIGWFIVSAAVGLFESLRPFIPWISLILLSFIGIKMILERNRDEGDERSGRRSPWELFMQGIATSIDALSVGFTIAEYDVRAALSASLIIAAVTFVLCMGGLRLGRTFGTKLAGKASILGGCILIAIGLEIFLSAMFGG